MAGIDELALVEALHGPVSIKAKASSKFSKNLLLHSVPLSKHCQT
jgi:hypothetical protein